MLTADVEDSRSLDLYAGVGKGVQQGSLDALHVSDIAGVIPPIGRIRGGIALPVGGSSPFQLGVAQAANTSGARSNASTAR
jgi:hypothetical protein